MATAMIGGVVCILIVGFSPASASADPSPYEIASYGQDFSASPEQARTNLTLQSEAAGIVEFLQKTLKERYAGLWFDNDDGKFHIAIVPGVDGQEVRRSLVEDFGLPGRAVVMTPARSTWKELEGSLTSASSAIREKGLGKRVAAGIDPENNALEVTADAGTPTAEVNQIADGIEGSVTILPTKRPQSDVETLACITVEPRRCDKPLRGGVELGVIEKLNAEFSNAFMGVCTIAFKGTDKVTGQPFVLTAGHCFPDWSSSQDTWMSRVTNETFFAIGKSDGYTFSGVGDYGRIKAQNSWWSEIPQWPSMVAHYWGDQTYPINYEAYPYKGQYLCFSGARSGTSCGNVNNLNVSGMVNQEGQPLPPMAEVPGVCVKPGDSGGPFFSYSSNTAVGILSAGELGGSCASNIAYFDEVVQATDALNVTVGYRIGGAPIATTSAATGIGGTQATLNAQVNPNAVETSYRFDYGTTTSYGQSTGTAIVGHEGQPVGVSAGISGLEPATIYHYRVVATSAAGTAVGSDVQFETGPGKPVVVNEPASGRTVSGLTFNGSVNPRKAATKYWFGYGQSTQYGTSVPVPALSVGNGKAPVAVSQSVSGLQPETLYHRALFAENEFGLVQSNDRTVTTLARTPTSLTPFGAKGTATGQLERPAGLDVDGAGNVWVVDRVNSRVSKYSPSGTHLLSFGKKGFGPGEFNEPRALAISPDGRVWVTDWGNKRVEVFSSTGQFQFEIGPQETSIGQLSEPYGIVIAEDGTLWVSDMGTNRLAQYSQMKGAEGYFLRAVDGVKGSGTVFDEPTEIDLDAEGDVWVPDFSKNAIFEVDVSSHDQVDKRFDLPGAQPLGLEVKSSGSLLIVERANNRVEQFSPNGEWQAAYGTKGTEPGQLTEPCGIAVYDNGFPYISDSGNARIVRWKQEAPPAVYDKGVTGLTRTSAVLNGSVNPLGLSTTYQFEYGPTSAYGSQTAATSAGSGTGRVSVSAALSGLAAEGEVHYRLKATSSAGTSYTQDRSFAYKPTATFSLSFGTPGQGPGNFERPIGSDTDSAGNVWVVDRLNNRVMKFGPSGEFLLSAGSQGSGPGQLNNPMTIAVAPSGNIWVTDFGNSRLEIFSSTGGYVGVVGPNETISGKLSEPYGITIDGSGNVYVADDRADRVAKYRSVPVEGKYFVETCGTFAEAGEVDTDADGDIWVADKPGSAVWEIPVESSCGAPKLRFSGKGQGGGAVPPSEPVGLKVLPSGGILTVNRGTNSVADFSPSGQLLAEINPSGSGQLWEPTGISVFGSWVYVTDSGNKRVQKWKLE
jgi:streptogramin lyase